MHDIRNNQDIVTNENNLRSITASKSQSSSISDLIRSSLWNNQFCQKRIKEKVYYIECLFKIQELIKINEKINMFISGKS